MQVVLHAGVHQTDGDRLFKTLLRNREAMRPLGVSIPGPGKYRKLISEMLNALGGQPPSDDARDVLLDSILDDDAGHVDRLILSHEHFFSVPKIAFQGGMIYRKAEQRLEVLQDIFDTDALEIFISVRNPATFLPALMAATPHDSVTALLSGLDPREVLWSGFIERVAEAMPGTPITVWSDEDSPLIWGELVRDILGVEPNHPIIGAYSRLADIMTQEGMDRFRAYLADRPDLNEAQIRRVMVAFLDKYADPSVVEAELDVPHWTEEFVAELTDEYDNDMFEISRLPGVTLISP